MGDFPWERLETLKLMFDLLNRSPDWTTMQRACAELADLDEMLRAQEITQEEIFQRLETTANLYSLASMYYSRHDQIGPALTMLERGKTRILRERAVRDQALFLLLKDDDRREYERLAGELKEIEAGRQGKASDSFLFETSKRIRSLQSHLMSLIERIRRYEPEFLAQEYINYQDIIARLPAGGDTALIVYNVTRYGTAASILAGKPDEPVEMTFIIDGFSDKKLKDYVARWMEGYRQFKTCPWRNECRLKWGAAVEKITEELFRELFQPIKPCIDDINPDTLVFIPHKALHILPLHLFNRVEDRTRRYLLEDYRIIYSPSLTMLGRHIGDEKTFGADNFATLVSDPTDELFWSRREIGYIERLFRNKRVFEGAAARINDVMESAVRSGVLHFSCHGEFDMNDPYESRLILAPPARKTSDSADHKKSRSDGGVAGDCDELPGEAVISDRHKERERKNYSNGKSASEEQDNDQIRKISVGGETELPEGERWTLRKILKELRIPDAQLAMLSACESGIVNVENLPDEYIGLPAGFLAAGARRVVSSLWIVDDKSTFELMKRFYDNLIGKKMSAADALRDAQLYIKSEVQFANPFFWGAFQMSGF